MLVAQPKWHKAYVNVACLYESIAYYLCKEVWTFLDQVVVRLCPEITFVGSSMILASLSHLLLMFIFKKQCMQTTKVIYSLRFARLPFEFL